MSSRTTFSTFVAVLAGALGLGAAGSAAALDSFVEYPPTPAELSGHVYFDENGNGVQDPGEPDSPGVQLEVLTSEGATIVVTTDADGDWSLLVPPGDTVVDLVESTLPSGAFLTQGDDVTSLTLAEGEVADPIIHGYSTVAGVVAGHIYLDSNGNGTQDPGEPNLSNVAVDVTPAECTPSQPTCPPIRVLTDANGDWSLVVPPGETVIDVDETTLPAGVTISEGSDTTVVTVVAGETTRLIVNGYRTSNVTVPPTGTNATAMGLRAGAGAIGIGVAFVLVARRRRTAAIA